MEPDRPSAFEIFNAALDAFRRGDLDEAVACLRVGFFENLHVVSALLGEPFETAPMWQAGAGGEPEAAAEYARRYGAHWREPSSALSFLASVWSDSLVRGEIRSFVNISKAIVQTDSETQRADLIRERERFADVRRVRRTQSDIIARIRASELRLPLEPPRVALILLASRDPAASVAFYRTLFRTEPVASSRLAGGYAEFELPGVRLAIHGHDRLADGDPYDLGGPPRSLGWGAIFVIRVSEFDRYWENAVAGGLEAVDEDTTSAGGRFLLLKDPSGYLIEVTEERDPEGL